MHSCATANVAEHRGLKTQRLLLQWRGRRCWKPDGELAARRRFDFHRFALLNGYRRSHLSKQMRIGLAHQQCLLTRLEM